ncbi:MAG: LysE family translocator [Alphaproteobacteria bacterium]
MFGPDASLAWLSSVAAFAVAMAATPGPNNAMVAASGATFGLGRTWPHILGIAVGFPAMLVALALGADRMLRALPESHVQRTWAALTWIGAAYMLWLAWRIAMARPVRRGPPTAGAESPPARGRPFRFVEAALFQWVNPKAWVVALGAVATYTRPEALVIQTLVIAAVFFAVCVPSCALWTGIGAGAARLLRTERAIRAFNIAMAALLVASLVPIIAA